MINYVKTLNFLFSAVLYVVFSCKQEKDDDTHKVGYPHHPEGGVVVDGFG